LVSFYVWYRVVRDDRETEAVVRGMLARLACRTGVRGRLLKKRDEPCLWMEVHGPVANPEGYESALCQVLDEFDVEMFVDGSRHSECFLEAPAPAATCDEPGSRA
jgi:hypothetical protein